MKKKIRAVDVHGILLSPRFLEAATQDEGVAIGFDPSVPYLRDYPWLFDAQGPISPLHLAVWDFYWGELRPRKPWEVVHHRDGNKMNATVENLGVGSRPAHGLAHALRRQRFTPRRRWRLFGFFRPRAASETRDLGFAEEMAYARTLLAREQSARESQERVRKVLEGCRLRTAQECGKKRMPVPVPELPLPNRDAAEAILSEMLPALRVQVDHLDSGKKVPPPEARPRAKKDRLLGISRIRRGCTPGEAALVRLLVKHQFDYSASALEAKLPAATLKRLAAEPAVSLAVTNWRLCGRLPPPCSPSKLKAFGWSGKK